MKKIIILLFCCFCLSCANQNYNSEQDILSSSYINMVLKKEMKKQNKLCQDYYDFNCVNNVYFFHGSMVFDLNKKTFQFSPLSIEDQIDLAYKQLKHLLDDVKKYGIVKRYIYFVDGIYYKTIEIE